MIALSALRHLAAELTRDIELGPRDHRRKLGEALEPAEYPAVRRRLRDQARNLRVSATTDLPGACCPRVTPAPPPPSSL